MKKIFITTLFAIVFSLAAFASINYVLTPINLIFRYYDPQKEMPILHPRIPAQAPIVNQYGHTILWGYTEFCESVQIVDLDNEVEVIYETTIPSTAEQVVLPESLQGSFEIRFMRGTYYYSGIIDL